MVYLYLFNILSETYSAARLPGAATDSRARVAADQSARPGEGSASQRAEIWRELRGISLNGKTSTNDDCATANDAKNNSDGTEHALTGTCTDEYVPLARSRICVCMIGVRVLCTTMIGVGSVEPTHWRTSCSGYVWFSPDNISCDTETGRGLEKRGGASREEATTQVHSPTFIVSVL